MDANPFDQFDGADTSENANDFDQFDSSIDAKAPPPNRTIANIAGDVGVTALKGVVALPQSIVGLADIVTGGHVGKAAEGLGVRFGDAQKSLDAMYSGPQQEANRKVAEAKGFGGKISAALENPSVIATTAGESLPQMLGGAGIARGLLKAGAVAKPWLAGAIGEGVMGAGSAEESIREQSTDGLTTGKQSLAAVGSGVGTAAFGALGGKLAQRFNFGDIDTILARGGADAIAAGAAKKGFVRQILESGISEGAFEEMPQSMQEQAWQNYATGKPLMEGVPEAGGMGLLVGGAMGVAGGGYNAIAGARQQDHVPLVQGAGEDAAAIQALDPNGTLAVNGATLVPVSVDRSAPTLTRAAQVAAQSGATPAPSTDADLLAQLQGNPIPAEQVLGQVEPEVSGASDLISQGEENAQQPSEPIPVLEAQQPIEGQDSGLPQQALQDSIEAGAVDINQVGAEAQAYPAGDVPVTATAEDYSAVQPEQSAPAIQPTAQPIAPDSPSTIAPAILQKSGKPFKTKGDARLALETKRLKDTHQIVAVDGGFGLQEKPAPVPRKKSAPVTVNPENHTLLQAVAILGVDPADALANDLRKSLGLRDGQNLRVSVPGSPPMWLFRKNGQRLDTIAGDLSQQGQKYLDAHDRKEMLDRLMDNPGQRTAEGEAIAAHRSREEAYAEATVTAEERKEAEEAAQLDESTRAELEWIVAHGDDIMSEEEADAFNLKFQEAQDAESSATREAEKDDAGESPKSRAPGAQDDSGEGETGFALTGETESEIAQREHAAELANNAEVAEQASARRADDKSTEEQRQKDNATNGNAADAFSMTAQEPVSKSQQKRLDAQKAKSELQGQPDIFSAAPAKTATTTPSETAKPASEMSAAELLRAAADKMDAENAPVDHIADAGKMVGAAQEGASEFIKSPDGSIDFGEITAEQGKAMRRQAGSIRLNLGVQNTDGTGYGLVHIEARHGKEIRASGFKSIEEFVSAAVKQIDAIWKPGSTTQLVAVQSGDKGKVMFLELQPANEGGNDYYRVNSAFPVDEKYVARKEKKEKWVSLWSRDPVSADASGAPGFVDQSPDAGETTPTVSPQGEAVNIAPGIDESKPVGSVASIEDFGEKISGARKEYAATYKDRMAEAMKTDALTLPLSKSWPEPDYQKLVDSGYDKNIVGLVRSMRDEIPNKPGKDWKQKTWAKQVEALRDTADKLLNNSEFADKFVSEMKKAEHLKLEDAINGRAELYALLGHEKSLKGVRLSRGQYGVYNGVPYNPPKIIWEVTRDAKATAFWNMPKTLGSGDTRQAAIDSFVKAYSTLDTGKEKNANTKFELYADRYAKAGDKGQYFIGKKVGRNVIHIKDGFDTVKEARAYIADRNEELTTILEQKKAVPHERYDINQPRIGQDMRNAQDVTPQMFSDALGFRGVQFGNYVEGARRQKDLNDAYDALMDLAAVLDVPPKALSLNGELGLAFGARGTGGKHPASAHYEPGQIVINLTKGNGAGSLAHEFWHSMDNYFSRMAGKKGDFATDRLDVSLASRDSEYQFKNDGIRKEMIDAFGAVVKSINNTSMLQRARSLDSRRTKEYWGTGIEMSARSFERYVIAKLHDNGFANDYLANVVSEEYWNAADALGIGEGGSYPYPTESELPAIRAGFDKFFQTIETKETDQGTALFNTNPGAAIPESEWLSVGAIVEEVDQLLKPFATEIPVLIRDTLADIGVKTADDGVTSGAVHGGRIHLFRDGLADRPAVVRTLWHELLHFGFRRFMTEPQYIAKMGDLYMRDGWVRGKANAWMQGADGKELAKTKNPGYVRARGVDEALAELAEIMQTEPTGYRNNTKLAQAKRAASEWVAKMADFFGFKEAAQAWRGYAAQKDARDLIVSTFAKLRDGAPPSSLNSQWHYSDPAFMVAWHGSPHDHDKFDSSKIGTGEGAQAYGHGLYFAGSREVAEWYKTKLSSGSDISTMRATKDGKELVGYDLLNEYFKPGRQVKGYAGIDEVVSFSPQQYGDNYKPWHVTVKTVLDQFGNAPKSWDAKPRTHATQPDAKLVKDVLESDGWAVSKGHLYQVELAPFADEYLDWDKPLSEQSESVKDSLGGEMDVFIEERGDITGGQFYNALADDGGQEAASEHLHSIGIRGIRYLDGSSRSAGEGNSNYVIFDDADVSITAKYSRNNAAGTGLPIATIQFIVDQAVAKYPRLAGVVHVVQSASELPEGGMYSDTEGAYLSTGEIYLVADNLPTERRAMKVLAHESIGHLAMEEMLNTVDPKLWGRLVNQIDTLEKTGNKLINSLAKTVDERQPGLSKTNRVKEVLALMAEDNIQNDPLFAGQARTVFQRFIDGIKSFMKLVFDVQMTDKEVLDIVKMAERHLGEKAGSSSVVEGMKGAMASRPPISQQSPLPGISNRPPPSIPQQPSLGLTGGAPGNNASWDAPEASKLDSFIYQIQNKHIDMKRVKDSIEKSFGAVVDKWNPYLKEELFHERAASRIKGFVESELTPMLETMAKEKISQAELGKYLWARHAKEANAYIATINSNLPDGGSGMTDQESDDYMTALAPAMKQKMEGLAKQIDAINHKTRLTLVNYGLISPNDVTTWENTYKHYIPLNREDMDHLGHGNGMGQGFSIKGQETKRRTGSELAVAVGEVLGNIAMQRERAITRGEKNRVGLALFGMAKLNPNPDFWTTDKAPTIKVVQKINGQDQVVEMVDPLYKTKDNVVVVKIPNTRTGKVEEHAIVFDLRNERAVRMASAIKNLDGAQLGEVMSATAKVTRYFASINTQYNPIFGVLNLTRDVQTAMLNLSNTPLAGKQLNILNDTRKILAGAMKHGMRDFDGNWKTLSDEFHAEGGATGYRDVFATGKERAEALQKALDPDWWTKTAWGKTITLKGYIEFPMVMAMDKGLRPVLNWLSDYNETMENAVRLAAYKEAKAMGLSKEQAASIAKNLTVNFNRKGEKAMQVGAMYAFFNAAVQGMTRDGSTLRGPAGKRIIMGGLLVGAVQAMALAFAGFGDDEPPEFVKERNLIFPIGNGKYLTLPMPLTFNVLPNLGRIATELMLSGGKKAGDKAINMFGILLDASNPLGGSSPILQIALPTVADPLAALAQNKDWTGKPIYREDFSGLHPTPGFTRSKDTSSAPSRWLAEAINTMGGGDKYTPGKVSPTPDQIDYLIGQVTGGVGRELSKGATTATALATGEDLPAHKIPLVGRFYGDTTGQASQGGRFYENLKHLNKIKSGLEGRMKDRLPTEEFKRDNPDYRLIGEATNAERTVSELRREKHRLIGISADKAKIKDMEARITTAMKRLNDRVEQSQKGPN